MGSYRLTERWEQVSRDLRRQWTTFREAHLVQDEQYEEKVTGQFPRYHAGAWAILKRDSEGT